MKRDTVTIKDPDLGPTQDHVAVVLKWRRATEATLRKLKAKARQR